MAYNQPALERYRADALAGRPFRCDSCPYCNGTRSAAVKHVHPSTKPSSPWAFWQHVLTDKYRAVQSAAAKENLRRRIPPSCGGDDSSEPAAPSTSADPSTADAGPRGGGGGGGGGGGPKHFVVGPMVDQSELPFRMLCRQHGATLAYTPMLHAKSFAESSTYRQHFLTTTPLDEVRGAVARARQPKLPPSQARGDEEEAMRLVDRPCIVQFCAHDADTVLQAARYAVRGEYTDATCQAAPVSVLAGGDDAGDEEFFYHCDAVDLNLGCPQGIARRGHYGSFLMEDWDLIHTIIHTLHVELEVPVTVKIRVFDREAVSASADAREQPLPSSSPSQPTEFGTEYDEALSIYYAQMIRDAGAQLLCIHGRTREMKGQQSGLANLPLIGKIRAALRGSLPVLSNGNVLSFPDVLHALQVTGSEGHMCAEPLLWDAALFANPSHPVPSGRLPHGATKAARLAGLRTAQQYVRWVRHCPVDIGFVKSHLFKMCYHSYELHHGFREALGSARPAAVLGDGAADAVGAAAAHEDEREVHAASEESQQLDAIEAHLEALLRVEEASDVVGEQPKAARAEKLAAKACIVDVFDSDDGLCIDF